MLEIVHQMRGICVCVNLVFVWHTYKLKCDIGLVVFFTHGPASAWCHRLVDKSFMVPRGVRCRVAAMLSARTTGYATTARCPTSTPFTHERLVHKSNGVTERFLFSDGFDRGFIKS